MRKALRKAGPWALALLILVLLVRRVPLVALRAALAGGPWLRLLGFVLVEVATILLADAWAATVALRASGGDMPYLHVLRLRGATYLLSIIHPLAGQGSFGWFLARGGDRAGWNAGGLVILLLATQALALALGGAVGALFAPPAIRHAALPIVGLIAIGLVVYALVLTLRPRALTRLPLLEPLFACGIRGHLVTVGARLPHVALLVLFQWGAARVWGIPVPLLAGLALIPVLLFVGALPITPSGLGAVQAAQVTLFARYAIGATSTAREATVLALSFGHLALALPAQALIGLLCLRGARLTTNAPRDTPPPC